MADAAVKAWLFVLVAIVLVIALLAWPL